MEMPTEGRDRVGKVDETSSAPPSRRLPLAEIRRLNAKIDAFSEIFPDARHGYPDGPLAGLTFAVKEVIDQEGRRTSWGTELLRDRVPDRTATVVSRVQAAGASCIGTARSTVLAIAGESATRNPRDLTRSPGGSSSGPAAAVAAGMVDFAIGTQTVGSIIRPASYCGVVGFKPSFGRLPTDGVMPLSAHLDHVGVLARDVDLARRVYEVFVPRRRENPAHGPILVPDNWFDTAAHSQSTRMIERTADRLADAGFDVRRIALPDIVAQNEVPVLYGILARGIHDHHRDFIARHRDSLPAELVSFAEQGAAIDDAHLAGLLQMCDRMNEAMSVCIDQGAFLLTPSTIDAPPKLGFGTGAREPQRLWTLIGWPSISLPAQPAAGEGGGDSLPMGIQLIGKFGSDHALLELADDVAAMARH